MLNNVGHINIRKIATIIAISFLLSVSCSKEQDQYVPTVPDFSIELDMTTDLANLGAGQLVTITPNKSQPDYSDLNFHTTKIPMVKIPFTCYGNGMVLCKGFDNEYRAYDLTCPVNAFTDFCSVTFKSNDIAQNCVCPCCKSEFILYNSAIPLSSSLAKRPLLQYKVSIISFNTRMLISK